MLLVGRWIKYHLPTFSLRLLDPQSQASAKTGQALDENVRSRQAVSLELFGEFFASDSVGLLFRHDAAGHTVDHLWFRVANVVVVLAAGALGMPRRAVCEDEEHVALADVLEWFATKVPPMAVADDLNVGGTPVLSAMFG